MGSLSYITLRRHSHYALLLSLLLAGSMWFYVRRVLVPHQISNAAETGRPRGILSDLYPRWLGARELLLRHRDPYSAEVTRDIQIGYYGRAIDPSRPNDPTDRQGFAYPVYVVFLLAPTIHLPFQSVEPVFRWLLVGLIAATLWGWLWFLGWRPSTSISIALLALTLGNFPVVQGILLEQLTLVVSALLAACLIAVLGGRLLLAGVLLGMATIKPQLVWPLGAWLCFWTVSDWRRRQRFFWGLCLTVALLEVGSELILPGWIGKFFAAVAAYRHYTHAQSIFSSLSTPTAGVLINCLVLIAIGFFCWRARHAGSTSSQFVLTCSLVLAATVVVVSSTALYNQVLLLPVVLILLHEWKMVWSTNLVMRTIIMTAAAFALWPWLASLGLLGASAFVPAEKVQQAWAYPLFSSLGTPPSVLALGLYYGRKAPLKAKCAA